MTRGTAARAAIAIAQIVGSGSLPGYCTAALLLLGVSFLGD